MERLQRVIAARGVSSRRSAEELITGGRVSVNGQTVTELGTRVNATADEIRVDGKVLRPQRLRTVLLNKPPGYITTTQDDRERRTVMELVTTRERLYPVGRLDRDTEGLLLLTNDGELANRIMHPRYRLAKEYHVLTTGRPPERVFQRLRDGIRIDNRHVVPDEVRLLRETREGIWIRLVVHEGFYHAVRRLMEAVNIPVVRLRRHRVGPVSVQGVDSGTFRDLSAGELAQLAEAVHLGREIEPSHNDVTAAPAPGQGRQTAPSSARSDRRRDRPAAGQRDATTVAHRQTAPPNQRAATSGGSRRAADRPGSAGGKTGSRRQTGAPRRRTNAPRSQTKPAQQGTRETPRHAATTATEPADPNRIATVGGRGIGPVTRTYRSPRAANPSGDPTRAAQHRSSGGPMPVGRPSGSDRRPGTSGRGAVARTAPRNVRAQRGSPGTGGKRDASGTPDQPGRRPAWARRDSAPVAPGRRRRERDTRSGDRPDRGTPIETIGRTRRRNQPGAPPATGPKKRRVSPHSHSHRGRKPQNRGTPRGRG